MEPFRDGERWALEQVYRTYVRELDGYLRALARAARCPELAQPSAIADSLHEVFVKAFSSYARQRYDSERPYGPYLRRIASNHVVDQLRARRRESEHWIICLPEEPEGVFPRDHDGVDDPRVRAVLATYLASLPLELRGVYEQRFVLGRTQLDACAVLGVTRRRLRTDEARLKSGLRKALAREGVLWRESMASVSLSRVKGRHAL